MDRGFDISWVGGQNTMGSGSNYHGKGIQNTMVTGFDIQWAIGENTSGRGVKIPWIWGSIYHE